LISRRYRPFLAIFLFVISAACRYVPRGFRMSARQVSVRAYHRLSTEFF
jgi:hypothetical protein